MQTSYGFTNHWLCLKDWFEFTLFHVIFDKEIDEYYYFEIIILNFEFVWNARKV